VRPDRTTSILHETGRSIERMVKLTRSREFPCPAICGLRRRRSAVTDVTFTTRFPDVAGGQSTWAFAGDPAKVPPVIPSTGTVSVTKPDVPVLAPNPTTVDPTVRPDRSTSIVQERGRSIERTMKLTCSAGIPALAICGLYGSRVAVTEVTFTTRFPDAARGREVPEADLGVELQPAHDAPTISGAARTDKVRSTR
jgi:hypothetical protein